MRKNIIYALCLAVLAAGFSACKKVESETINNSKTIVYKDGTVVEKNYKVTPGEPKKEETKPEVKEETPKRFFAFQAKRLLRKQLQKQNKERYVAVVRLGYYECNSYAERLQLLKLAANKLINLKVDEIMTANGPTYWVTASLTWRGWLLKEGPAKGLFPEDLITDEEAKAALLPSLDQDEWGVPTTDAIVPEPIKAAMKAFYGSLQAGNSYDKSLLDAKMQCAISLLDTLASYGVNKLGKNPFTRDAELTEAMVENLSVLRMPRMENAYLVTVGENSFLYVIENSAEGVTIVDLAYIAPGELSNLNQTVCSLAGKLTKEEILRARAAKRLRDEQEARMAEAMAASMPQEQEEPAQPEEDFEMCATSGSLKMVEHEDPTLYELAKKAERYEDVRLLGGVMKIDYIDELKVVGNKKKANASAQVTYLMTKVNAVGRIFLHLTEGTKEVKNVQFHYTKADGWQVGKGQPVLQPEEPAPCVEAPAFNQPAEEVDDEPSEDELSAIDWSESLNALEMIAE